MEDDGIIRMLFVTEPPDAIPYCPHFPKLKPTISCPFPGACAEVCDNVKRIGGFSYT